MESLQSLSLLNLLEQVPGRLLSRLLWGLITVDKVPPFPLPQIYLLSLEALTSKIISPLLGFRYH